MNEKIKVKFNNRQININNNMTLNEFLKKYYKDDKDIVGAKINNEIASYDDEIKDESVIEVLYPNDLDGNKIYKSGLKYVLLCAIYEQFGDDAIVVFEHSIDKGICFQIKTKSTIDDEDVRRIKLRMNKIIKNDLPITKINVSKKEAIKYFMDNNEEEKALNIQSVTNPIVILYKLKYYYNYFYTDMPYSTGCLKDYDIVYLGNNKFVLLFPIIGKEEKVPKYHHYPLNMRAFTEYKKWIESLNIKSVAHINNLVSHNKIADFIRTNELYLQKNILAEANNIYKRKTVKIVLMAGPSSSGKTTTSKKLSLALKTFGLKLFNISIDDYYLDHKDMPKQFVKNRDFESIDLIDLDLLNEHLAKLMNREEVILPTYNFHLGAKEFNTDPVSLDDNTIIIIEGNHALNPRLLRDIAENQVYKIYISPFEPLVIDRHNHLSTLDLRLIRRIVRDNQFRNTSAEETLKMWQTVRKGEEEYIFPYMQDVDTVLNTSLIYEMGVLKVYAEPLLYSIPVTSPVYEEAKRLIEFLNIFYPIPSEYVEKSSLLREFIGGSIFK